MATFYTNISAKAYADALSVGLFGAAASQNVENAAAVAMGIPPSQLASTIPTNLQVWNAGIALAQSPLFAAQYGSPTSTVVDAAFFTNLNTALTGSTFLLASELAAFQAVATTYGLNKAQAATYFVAVVLSTDPTSLGLSTSPNPGNPGGLSDQQTYINQFNAATNRAIVSGNYANQSASASNLNYPVAGPTTNPGYVGGQNAELGVTNATSTVVTAENQIAVAAAANNPALINGQQPESSFNLTPNPDTFTTSVPNAVFSALPFTTALGATVDTLTAGDNLTDSAGSGILNFTDVTATVVAGVTTTGISTANISGFGVGGTGFSGNITGLKTVSLAAGSTEGFALGLVGLGLKTALENVNINANQSNAAIISATALAGAADSVNVNYTGTVGAKGAGASKTISLINDSGTAGTAATPMNGYETINVSAAGKSYVQLSAGAANVMSTTTIKASGAGHLVLSAANVGDYSNVTSIDASTSTGGVEITGGLALDASGATVTAGLLAGNTVLKSFTGGNAADFIDLTGLTAAQVAAMTTLEGGSGAGDIVVLAAAQLNTATALKPTGFEIIGSGAGLTGAVDLSLLGDASVNAIKLYGATGGAVAIANGTSAFTYDAGKFQGGNGLTVTQAATGASDVLTLTHAAGVVGGATDFGALTGIGYESVKDTVTGTAAAALNYGAVTITPSAGSLVTYNLTDNQAGGFGIAFGGAFNIGGGTLVVTGTDTGPITLAGALTAGLVNLSGWTGATAGAPGFVMAGAATGAVVFTGSAGNDTITGSLAADNLSGGAGADIISNQALSAAVTTAADSLTGGTGYDQFALFGSTASSGAATVTAAVAAAPVTTDMTVGTTVATSDTILLNGTAAGFNYAAGALGIGLNTPGAQAAGTAGLVLNLVPNIAGQAAGTAQIIKMGSFTETPGTTTLATAIGGVIGTATVTVAAGTGMFFTAYDSTSSKMLIGLMSDGSGDGAISNTALDTATIAIVGSVNMTAANYAQFGIANIGTN